ncbi:MAG: hypothetical protein V7744_20640 [Pseudomonadales bacterium]
MNLIGGYGTTYDPSPAIGLLNTERSVAIDELWTNLYHQGDVGTASYSAVPQLVAHGELSLVGAIEVARCEPHNPPIPDEMVATYKAALIAALSTTPRDAEQYQGYYVIHASVNGQKDLAKALDLLSVEEIMDEYT